MYIVSIWYFVGSNCPLVVLLGLWQVTDAVTNPCQPSNYQGSFLSYHSATYFSCPPTGQADFFFGTKEIFCA